MVLLACLCILVVLDFYKVNNGQSKLDTKHGGGNTFNLGFPLAWLQVLGDPKKNNIHTRPVEDWNLGYAVHCNAIPYLVAG